MEIAKIVDNGENQTVLLPEKYRFSADEVSVQRLGSSLLLTQKNDTDVTEQNAKPFLDHQAYKGK